MRAMNGPDAAAETITGHGFRRSYEADDERRATLDPNWRTILSRQLERWRNLDRSWRDVLLVLIRLQGWYGPSVKGTLLKSTVTLVPHPETGESVDPRDLGPPFDPHRVLAELGLSLEALKNMHQRLAVHGMMMDGGDDPLRFWYILFRMTPAKQRAKLRGRARRVQDAYDAAEMLRRFYFDLTGELLPHADEIFDISDKSWRKRLFGQWPTLRYTRADLAVELRQRDLHPHQVHIAAEGETEKIVCERVLEALAGMPLKDTGVSVQRLFGVGNATLQQETLQALKAFPRYLILIADNEGDMKRQVERLQEEGVLTDETTFLWDTSFEEENFTDEELVAMIAAIGADRGATLTLDATTLRALHEVHRDGAGDQAKGLATFALNLAGRPDHGSVVASKTELAERMADLILEDLRQHDADEVSSRRPIASILISVFRVT
jgi:hypothetical protein